MIDKQAKIAAVKKIEAVLLTLYTEKAVEAGEIKATETEEAENEYRQFLLLNFVKRGLSQHGMLAPSKRAFEIWKIHCRDKLRYGHLCRILFGDETEPLVISKDLLKTEVYQQALAMTVYLQTMHCKDISGFTNYYETLRFR